MDKYLSAKTENKKWANRSSKFEKAYNKLKTKVEEVKKECKFLQAQHNKNTHKLKDQQDFIKKQKAEITKYKNLNASIQTNIVNLGSKLEALRNRSAAEISKDLDEYTKNQIAGLKATAQGICQALSHVETGKTVEIEVAEVSKYTTIEAATTAAQAAQQNTGMDEAQTKDDGHKGTNTHQRNDDGKTKFTRESSTGIMQCPN